ncbi:MAG: PQQ-binding-like beta-propeller repeat protein [Armatimonadetes bacterium]|nr:PQQ-binding-like beta-propeller repeat protein [Armatimonadota bacterium]
MNGVRAAVGGTLPMAILLSAATLGGAEDGRRPIWPMYRGDPQRTGQSPFKGPTRMRVKWELDLKHEICTAPAVGADGTLYAGAGAFSHAIAPDGTVRWSHDFVESGHARTSGSSNGPRQAFTSPTPALVPDGTLFLACGVGGPGFVMGLDSRPNAEKRILWEYKTGQEMRSSPLVAGRTCFVGSRVEGMALAFDGSGALRWPAGKSSFYGVTSSPALSPDGTTLYIGGFDGRLHALDAETGKAKWSAGPEKKGGIRLPEKDAGGKEVRRFTTAGHIPEAPAVAPDGAIYFGSWDGFLRAAAPDGKIRWAIDLKDRLTSAPALSTDGHILISSFEGTLSTVRVVGGKPVVAWQVEANSRYSSPLVSSDGKVYVGTMDGRLSAYALASGEKVGELALGGWVYASPVPGGDGILYVGASDGLLRAVE